MRRGLFPVFAGLLILTLLGNARQARVYGRVVNRDGVAQVQCQVDFNQGQQRPKYRAYTDRGGNFFIDNPQSGAYDVVVLQGARSAAFRVTVRGRFEPSVLVVPW